MIINYETKVVRFSQKNFNYSFLLYFGILLTIIQQMPVIRDNFYSELRMVLYLIFGLLSIISFSKIAKFKKPFLINLFLLTIILVLFEILFIKLFLIGIDYSDLIELIIPFGILISSYLLNISEKNIYIFINIYAFLGILMGILLVLYYGGNFFLREEYISGTSKNQTGPIISSSIICLTYFLFFKFKKTIKYLLLNIIFIAMGIASLVVLRNRSGLFGFLLVFIVMLLNKATKSINIKKIIIIIIIIITIFVLFLSGYFNPLIKIVEDSFTLNYDIYDLNSLSAGRINTYINALDLLKRYPFFGELISDQKLEHLAHNYLLNKAVKYGFFLSIPFSILYIYLWFFCLRSIILNKGIFYRDLSVYILLLGLIISLLEYKYPYGPGVSQVLVWFTLGQYLRKRSDNNTGSYYRVYNFKKDNKS